MPPETTPEPLPPLRFGVLGASRIAELSLVSPAAATGTELVAVAARDRGRAEDFAARHGVRRVLDSYAAVVADAEVEAVYNPLANGLHGAWNIASAEAGKHVLAEKPSAANAEEARDVRAAVQRSGVVFMEAFHYPYHPLWQRVLQLLDDEALGELEHVEATLVMPSPGPADPRWDLDLAGGALMDLGCYSLSALMLLGRYAGGSPRVVGGEVEQWPAAPGVDARTWLQLAYPSGLLATGGGSMVAPEFDFHLTVTGSRGRLHVPSFPRPHLDDTLVLTRPGREEIVEHLGTRSSYTYQLDAFTAAVRAGAPVVTDADFSVATMELIDDAYRVVGLEPRRPSAPSPVT